jgi:hypothetical protein
MPCTAAGKSFALHGEFNHLLLAERIAEKMIERHDSTCGRSGTRADSAARHDLAHEGDLQMLLEPQSVKHCAQGWSHDVVFHGGRNVVIRPVDDFDSISFRHFHAEDVSGTLDGHSHDVESTAHVGNGSRNEYGDLSHSFLSCSFIRIRGVPLPFH